ncbi:MAG: hypothetical protein U5S82_17615 [Gammaproteobacteria bacterium]|nr:hypothetical protein [Gammaproteobacteria bacterium]
MQDKSIPAATQLLWQGRQTVEEVRGLVASLKESVAVELQLPPDLHHTLYARLYPQATGEAVEEVALEGGAELLRRIEDLPGIDGLAAVRELVEQEGLKVRIVSPGPTIILYS